MVADKAITLAAVTAVLIFMSLITMVLRCWVRVFMVKAFGWDDKIMVFAMIVFIGNSVGVFLNAAWAAGDHFENVDPIIGSRVYLLWWSNYVTYGLSITLARVSIGLFFLRVTVGKYYRWFLWFTIGSNILAGVCFCCVTMFQCSPVNYYWLKVYPDAVGTCIPMKAFVGLGYLYGAICVTIDLTYVLYPLFLIRKLNQSKSARRGLFIVLAMAGIGGCAPLVRMAYLYRFYSPDFYYATVEIALWSTFEPGLAITASNLATLRPIYFSLTHRSTRTSVSDASRNHPAVAPKGPNFDFAKAKSSQPKTVDLAEAQTRVATLVQAPKPARLPMATIRTEITGKERRTRFWTRPTRRLQTAIASLSTSSHTRSQRLGGCDLCAMDKHRYGSQLSRSSRDYFQMKRVTSSTASNDDELWSADGEGHGHEHECTERPSWWTRVGQRVSDMRRKESVVEILHESARAVSPHAMREYDEIMKAGREEWERIRFDGSR